MVTGFNFQFIMTIAATSTANDTALVDTVVMKVVKQRGSEAVDKVEVVKVLPYCYWVTIDMARVPRGPIRETQLKMLKTAKGAKKYIKEVRAPKAKEPQL